MDNKAFDSKRIAQGYAKRPWLHKSVIEQIKKDCSLPKDFMLIQSNVNAQIESGSAGADEIKKWMMESLTPVFAGRERQLVFYGYSWYIRKGILTTQSKAQ